VSEGNLAETINYLTEVHEQFDNGTPIEYHFLDSQIGLFYQNEQRAGKIFLFGAFLVIFIACLGLFGLVSFMVQKRTKEIGIRKVLGASSGGLYLLISTSFLKQIVVAWLIAAPLAYLAMTNWLSLFTYNSGFNPIVILVAGVAAIIVAMITVSYRSVSASFTNPAKTLKYE
jgi:putative ABC transport system permease protein